jgi:hypothetical protein
MDEGWEQMVSGKNTGEWNIGLSNITEGTADQLEVSIFDLETVIVFENIFEFV